MWDHAGMKSIPETRLIAREEKNIMETARRECREDEASIDTGFSRHGEGRARHQGDKSYGWVA
jgi:hypothetical protein